jgi:hypothetical protein
MFAGSRPQGPCLLDGCGVTGPWAARRDDIHPRSRLPGCIGQQGSGHFSLVLEGDATEVKALPTSLPACLPKTFSGRLRVRLLVDIGIV